MKITFKALAASVALALALGSAEYASAAGLQSKMDSMFGEMSNVSRPGVFETQRRGVLAGGSAYVRNRIMNVDLVNLQAPSWKAGCGGIDFFGGSFSFINADQFVELLRTIASNAKGYAFQLALNIACADCMAWINNLQSKIQALNEAAGNSCQLAQGIVNDVASAFSIKRQNEYSLVGTVTGLKQDFFSSKNQTDGTDTPSQVDTTKPEQAKRIVGNIVWDGLKKSNSKSWIADPGDEKTEYGILMAVTGTIVIPKSVEDAANADTGNTTNPKYYPAMIEYADLLNGGTLKTYTCNDDQCLSPTTGSVTTVGMVKRIKDVLTGNSGTGTGASVGVLKKFSMMSGNAFTTTEENVMANMPAAVGAIVRRLATAAPLVAQDQVDDWAYAIAMAWANDIIRDQLKAVRQSIRTVDKPETKEMLQMITEREIALNSAYENYAKEHPTISQIVERYNAVQKNINQISVIAAGNPIIPSEGR